MPFKVILDPHGKAVKHRLNNLGISDVSNVRTGKHIAVKLEADNQS